MADAVNDPHGTKAIPRKKKEELLKEIRDNYTYGSDEWAPIRAEGAKDLLYLSGDPWDPKDKRARKAAGRPCLVLDELNQYSNQVVNDILANKRAIKVTPEGNGANDKTAELRAGIIRRVEYGSHAHQGAYATMFENTVQRSYGFSAVRAKYLDPKSMNQELVIEGFPNPDLVTVDPDHLIPDGTDMRWGFIEEQIRGGEREFKRRYPQAEVKSFSKELVQASGAQRWFQGDKIKVAEYWTVETVSKSLLLLNVPGRPNPTAIFEDEAKEQLGMSLERAQGMGVSIAGQRQSDVPRVWMYLTNGVEILSRKLWPGSTIPIICCYGKVLYGKFNTDGADNEKKILSLVRLARDPFLYYCWIRTCEAEAIAGVPRNAWIGYKGQFAKFEDDWTNANNQPTPYLEVNALTSETRDQILPLPSRQSWDPPLQNLEIAAESARRAIQAAMGTAPLPSSAQRRNEKSGVALQKIDESAQKGAYHLVDHYDAAIVRVGQVLEELIPVYYDAARDIATIGPDGTAKVVRINDPDAQGENGEPEELRTDVGDHDVTISVGPKADSEREAVSDFVDSMMGTPIGAVPGVAAMLVRMRNLGTMGDELADLLTPPELKKAKGGKQPSAQELQQALAQAQQQIQLLQQAGQQLQQQIHEKQLEQQTAVRVAQINASSREKIATIQYASATAVQELKSQVDGAIARMEADVAGMRSALDAQQANEDRAHDVAMAGADHAASLQASDAGHQQAMQQQAAAEPEPTEPAAEPTGESEA